MQLRLYDMTRLAVSGVLSNLSSAKPLGKAMPLGEQSHGGQWRGVRCGPSGARCSAVCHAAGEGEAELVEGSGREIDGAPLRRARLHRAGVGADEDGADGVPAVAMLEDFFEEGIGRELVAPVDEDERTLKAGAEEALPALQALDIVARAPAF